MEFNSTKNKELGIYINEIIEIGAVKLNEYLEEIGEFSATVKPHFTKKLNPYFKKLTKISDKDLKISENFSTVIENFITWCEADKSTVFLSWSDTDLHVLVENYNQLLKRENVDFITKYADLQKYIMSFLKTENNNQISLTTAAEQFSLSTKKFEMHRATDDSKVCGQLLKKTFENEKFSKYIRNTENPLFYRKLVFKPYIITDLKKAKIEQEQLFYTCPFCKNKIKFDGKFNRKFKAFCEIRQCKNCKNKIAATFRLKQNFDSVQISKRIKKYVKQKER